MDHTTETEDVIVKRVTSEGWKEFPTHYIDQCDRHWAKFYETSVKCHHNQSEKGIQVVLQFWEPLPGQYPPGLSISLRAQTAHGWWTNLTVDSTSLKDIDKNVDHLLNAWEAINKK